MSTDNIDRHYRLTKMSYLHMNRHVVWPNYLYTGNWSFLKIDRRLARFLQTKNKQSSTGKAGFLNLSISINVTRPQTYIYTHTHTHDCIHIYTRPQCHTLIVSFGFTLTLTHTHILAHIHCHIHSVTHSLTFIFWLLL